MNLLKIQPVYFNSASNTEMKTYPLVIKNFKLGEELIDELYFYLLMNDYNPDLSVLGVDFINYCSMHKELNSDIELRMLDSINYEKKFKENAKTDKILSLNLIMDKLNTSDEYETPRDIAAALRNLYHIDLRGWEGYDRS
jgi:hypothetical protein